MSQEVYEAPLIPIPQRPRGLAFYAGTWSGRIVALNVLVFIIMAARGSNILSPALDDLVAFGAKDPVRLAQGEWWRFFAPVFVHGGLIHLGFNMFGVYAIGYQLERVLGATWFLGIYLLSGVLGNVASAVFNVSVSVGASSALFGLLGCGYVLERMIGRRIEAATGMRPKQKVYAGMVFVNLLLGFMIPLIDNAAHLGGLVSGAGVTFAMLHLRRNRIARSQPWKAWATIAALTVLAAVGSALSMNKVHVMKRLEAAGDKSEDAAQSFYSYSRALELEPQNGALLIKRARLLIYNHEEDEAFVDLTQAAASSLNHAALRRFASELDSNGYRSMAAQIENLVGK